MADLDLTTGDFRGQGPAKVGRKWMEMDGRWMEDVMFSPKFCLEISVNSQKKDSMLGSQWAARPKRKGRQGCWGPVAEAMERLESAGAGMAWKNLDEI